MILKSLWWLMCILKWLHLELSMNRKIIGLVGRHYKKYGFRARLKVTKQCVVEDQRPKKGGLAVL